MSAASRYRIGRQIKRGGMAEVYEASLVGESGFERRVAIKRLLPGYDPEDADALADEARIASQLHHAGIVGVLDFGTLDGVPFVVTELVDGVDVTDLWALVEEHGRTIPIDVALRITVEVGYALAHAHKARDANGRLLGLIHRDVSPENVLLSWTGDVKLTDFGIARAPGRRAQTKVGETKGKLGFMAPEQLRGEDVDARTDVFGLGCLLHFAAVKTSPLEIAPQLAGGELKVTIDPALPEDVRAIVERATAIDPRRRFQSAGEMAEACAAALFARVRADPRSIAAAFLAPLKPRVDAPARKARAGDLLELALVSDEFDGEGATSPASGPRRFTSIIATQENVLVADGIRTERAQIPVVSAVADPWSIAPVTAPITEPFTAIVPTITAPILEPIGEPTSTIGPTIVTDDRTLVRLAPVAPQRTRSFLPFVIAALLSIPAGLMIAFAFASARREENTVVVVPAIGEPRAVEKTQTPTARETFAEESTATPTAAPTVTSTAPSGRTETTARTEPTANEKIAVEKPPKRAKTDTREEAELRAAIAKRGLELADLASLAETERAYREWKDAKKIADRRRLAAAIANLKTRADTAPIPLALVKSKLQRVQAALNAAAGKRDSSALEPFYTEYLELRSAARANATPEECATMLRRTRALLERIEREPR